MVLERVSTLRVLVNAPYFGFLLTYQPYGFEKINKKIKIHSHLSHKSRTNRQTRKNAVAEKRK